MMTHEWVFDSSSDNMRCITHLQELNEATVRSLIERGCPHNGVAPS